MNKEQLQALVDKLQVCHDEHVPKGEVIAHEHTVRGDDGLEVTTITWTELLDSAKLALNSIGPSVPSAE